MKDLYQISRKEALDSLIEEAIKDHPELTKRQAETLVCNALMYNVVIASVGEQINFLLDID